MQCFALEPDVNTEPKDNNFFERVEQEARDALTKEEISQKRKKREENIEEVITIAQCQVKKSC